MKSDLVIVFCDSQLTDEVQRTGAWVNSCVSYLQRTFMDWMDLQQGYIICITKLILFMHFCW